MGWVGGLGDVFSSEYPLGKKKCKKCGHAHDKRNVLADVKISKIK
jgi:hypothetical protein